MSSLKIISFALILLNLSACSIFEPFVDRRRNAGVADIRKLYVGRSKPQAPAVCYNGLWTNEAKIQEMADAECRKHGTGSHAEKVNKTMFSCKILLPSHAYYKCIK